MNSEYRDAYEVLNELSTSEEIDLSGLYKIYGDISFAFVAYRIENDMNQTEFAKYLNVSQPMVSKYESGDYNFSLEALYKAFHKIGIVLKIDIPNNVFAKKDDSHYYEDTFSMKYQPAKIDKVEVYNVK